MDATAQTSRPATAGPRAGQNDSPADPGRAAGRRQLLHDRGPVGHGVRRLAHRRSRSGQPLAGAGHSRRAQAQRDCSCGIPIRCGCCPAACLRWPPRPTIGASWPSFATRWKSAPSNWRFAPRPTSRLHELGRDHRRNGAGPARRHASRGARCELDLEFHAQILRMTGSRLIAGMQQILVQFFQIAPHSERTAASAERIIWEHRELLTAIRDRDVERARAMIRMQIRATLDAGGFTLPGSADAVGRHSADGQPPPEKFASQARE